MFPVPEEQPKTTPEIEPYHKFASSADLAQRALVIFFVQSSRKVSLIKY